MSYNELSVYGRLRKVDKLGPYGMVRIRPVSFLYFCCFSNFKRLQALESLLLLKKKMR